MDSIPSAADDEAHPGPAGREPGSAAGEVVLQVRGVIDAAALGGLRDAVAPHVERGPRLVLDLSAVTFMDSSCLEVLDRARRTLDDAGGSLVLRNPSDAATRLLSRSGTAGGFEIDVVPASPGSQAGGARFAAEGLPGRSRDGAGERRDASAEDRDRAADLRDRLGDARDQDARDRRFTISDHRRARQQSAADRISAADDRLRSRVDRERATRDRYDAGVDREEAMHDALTGLMGRGPGLSELQREIARSGRSGEPMSLGFIDVDGLKHTNDTFGHQAGDAALVSVAQALTASMRSYDVVSRIGGDEFLIGAPNMLFAGLVTRMTAVRDGLASAPDRIGVSFGVAELRAGDDAAALVARADEALYAGRRGARHGD